MLAFALGYATAQSISLNVSNIPGSATRLIAVADSGGISVTPPSSTNIAAGTATTTMNVAVAGSGTYRVRCVAFVARPSLPIVLRSGSVAGAAVTTGTTPASVSMGDRVGAPDPSTPVSAPAGSPVTVTVDIRDPGDFLQGGYGQIWYSSSPFAQNLLAAANTPGTTTRTSPGQYQFAASLNLPASPGTMYYQVAISNIAFLTANEFPLMVWPDVRSAPPAQISIGTSVSVNLTVSGIPAAATRLVAVVDGGGLAGPLRSAKDVTTGSSSAAWPIGVQSGGMYRLRVVAFAAGPSLPVVLRAGQVTGVSVGSSNANALVTLADFTVTVDSVTPMSGTLSAPVTIVVDLADPGDFLEGSAGDLWTATAPYVQNLAAASTLRTSKRSDRNSTNWPPVQLCHRPPVPSTTRSARPTWLFRRLPKRRCSSGRTYQPGVPCRRSMPAVGTHKSSFRRSQSK